MGDGFYVAETLIGKRSWCWADALRALCLYLLAKVIHNICESNKEKRRIMYEALLYIG